MARRSIVSRGLERLQEFSGYSFVPTDVHRLNEAMASEAFVLANDLEDLGYTALNYSQGRPNELLSTTRKRWVQKARVAWQDDPQAGSAVEMLNEFSFGRGVPRPRAKNSQVQDAIDEFWDHPQNQRVLTTYQAQMRFGTSLSIQSNVWFLMFDDGDDHNVVLSFLNHDTVWNAYTDPRNRQRVLFWIASEVVDEFDFRTNTVKPKLTTPRMLYYEAWGTVKEALMDRGATPAEADEILKGYRKVCYGIQEETGDDSPEVEAPVDPVGNPVKMMEPYDTGFDLMLPPPNKVARGKVYHVGENFDMESVFGVPRMRRVLRWYTAYEDFMSARVKMAMAATGYIAEKKLPTGSPNTLAKQAAAGLSRVDNMRTRMEEGLDAPGMTPAPEPGSFVVSSGQASFNPLSLNSGAGNANTDGQMIRGMVSAGVRFPQHYLGDVGSANLATATSMELPVLKHVEGRQELGEGTFRWALDRQIELKIEAKEIDPSKLDQDDSDKDIRPQLIRSIDADPEVLKEAGFEVLAESVEMVWRIHGKDERRPTRVVMYPDGGLGYDLLEALEEEEGDLEAQGEEVDFDAFTSYEFAMPSPLRRMMTDVIQAVSQIATFADPNGENVELTRILVTYALSEGLEMQDAAELVALAFPKGYVPMAVQAMQQQLAQGAPGAPLAGSPPPPDQQRANFFGPDMNGVDSNPAGPYGTPSRARYPEEADQEGYAQESALLESVEHRFIRRDGLPVVLHRGHRQPRTGHMEAARRGRAGALEQMFRGDVRGSTMEALAELDMNRLGNGDGGGQ